MVKFKFLTGDCNVSQYGGKFISNKQNNGEFDYYFVIELMNWKEAVGEREAPAETYNVCLSVVSPMQAGEKNLKEAYSCCGIDEEMVANAGKNLAEIQVEALHAYAGGVPVWQGNGNNWRELMKEAKKEAQNCEGFFGFYLDKPVNALGETGWERLRLADVKEVLDRVCPTDETRLVSKLMS